jgi:hypothetical protein
MILTSYGVRLPVFGDGDSNQLKIDLRETLFLMGEGNNYQLIPDVAMPHQVLNVTVGGPSITPETEQQCEVSGELDGYELTLKFAYPLLKSKDSYAVEIVFGRVGILPEIPETEVEWAAKIPDTL